MSPADAHHPTTSKQDVNIDQKITLLNKEINVYGKITKFNIDDILTDIRKTGNIVCQ